MVPCIVASKMLPANAAAMNKNFKAVSTASGSTDTLCMFARSEVKACLLSRILSCTRPASSGQKFDLRVIKDSRKAWAERSC
jgi:hypothetical protein